jgi:GDPmannose 4,6-dehydratase
VAAFGSLGLDFREYVVSDPAFVRAVDPATLVADSTRLKQQLGWTPHVTFSAMIEAMVQADVDRLSRGEA